MEEQQQLENARQQILSFCDFFCIDEISPSAMIYVIEKNYVLCRLNFAELFLYQSKKLDKKSMTRLDETLNLLENYVSTNYDVDNSSMRDCINEKGFKVILDNILVFVEQK